MALIESQQNPGVVLETDPAHRAGRISVRPLDHTTLQGKVLGHYRVVAVTGTTVSVAAAGVLSYLRWTDPTNFLVLIRCEANIAVPAAITAATVVDLGLFIGRGGSAAGSGGGAINLLGNNQKNRVNMAPSLITDARVATTAALTAPTSRVADAAPIGAAAWAMLSAPTLGSGASTAVAVGAGEYLPIPLYKWDGLGQYPIVLSANEDIEAQLITAGPVTGGIKYYITWEWAEVVAF